MKPIYRFFISFFYIGYISNCPGSLASMVALIIFFYIPNILMIQFIILFVMILLGFFVCYDYSKNHSIKDPSFIVIDEVSGMFLSLFMLPKSLYLYALAYILFRFFDIYKPGIINYSQSWNRGIGIMMDDLLSGLITVIIIWGIYLCL